MKFSGKMWLMIILNTHRKPGFSGGDWIDFASLFRVKKRKAESGLSKQLLSNFRDENSCDHNQLEAEVKNRVAYKKGVSGKVSEIGEGTERGSLA